MNVYILVDPNGGFKKTVNDPFALVVFGLGTDKNFYLLDAYCGHLNPSARQMLIIRKQAQWEPLEVRIEEKTTAAETWWLKEKQQQLNHRFEIVSVSPQTMKLGQGGYTRPERLTDAWEPLLEQNRLYLPEHLWVDGDDGPVDMTHAFREELRRFPIGHDDLMSAGALLFCDHGGKRGTRPLIWPTGFATDRFHSDRYNNLLNQQPSDRAWMSVG